jgi:hypothetical protein
MAYQNVAVQVSGRMSLQNDLTMAGTLSVMHGDMALNGHTLTAGTVEVIGSGSFLTMTDTRDSLDVGLLNADGDDETGHLTAGSLHVRQEALQQDEYNSNSFVASGAHRTILGDSTGPVAVVYFMSSGPTASRFHDLDMGAPLNVFQAPFVVSGALRAPRGLHPVIAGPGIAIVSEIDLVGARIDGAGFTILGGPMATIDSLTFVNVPAGSALTIAAPGSGAPISLASITFPALPPTGCSYITAVDTDGLTPALVLDITSNLTPAEGAGCTNSTGGPGPVQAQVIWH